MQAQSTKTKKKGPLRWEAIVPAAIFFALVGLYMHFFFDNHLRKLIEFGATRGVGAEVNVRDLKISFLKSFIKIDGIEVTDKSNPARNLFEIGTIHFDLIGDALLRAKFVVEKADVLNIKIHSPRKRPGRVLPPSQEPPITDEAKKITVSELEESYGQTVLGDLGKILGGIKPEDQLKNIEADLKSTQKFAELEKALDERKKQWEDELKSLPKDEDLKAYEAKFKSIKTSGFKDIKEVQESIKAFDELYKSAQKDVKAVEATSSSVSEYLKWVNDQIKEAQAIAQSDVKGLLQKLNIPSLDSDSLTQALFAGLVLSKIQPLFAYLDKAEKYMPTKRTQEQPITPRERQEGRNFQFPITKGYPLFWLQSSTISSKSAPGSEYGDFTGKLTDVTDNPRFVGKPAVFELTGNVPAHSILGIHAKIVADHTGKEGPPKQSVDLSVASYPVGEQLFGGGNDVKLGFTEAKAKTTLAGFFSEGNFNLDLTNEFSDMNYIVEASSSSLQNILNRALSGIKMLDLRVRLGFQNKKLSINMRSNLGSELEKAVKREIDTQIKSATAQVEKFVNEKLAAQKASLQNMLSDVEKKIGIPLSGKKSALNDQQKKIEQAKDQAVKEQTKGATDKAKEEGKKLLKGLGF